MKDFTPRKYQTIAEDFILNKPFCALLLDMGLGKTVTTLTAIQKLIYDAQVFKPLIIAPKLVVRHTWPAEVATWKHLRHLTVSVIAGDEKKRIKALSVTADVYLISRDNIVWLVKYLGLKKFNFDMLVIDESSSFKNHRTQRFKAVKAVLPKLKRVVELTGTPVPNGLADLWSQIYLLDRGERLYKFITTFRNMYFQPERNGFGWKINPGAEPQIFDKVKDICLSMKAADWLDLPARQDIIREIELDDYSEYKAFRKEKILELPEGQITAFNAGALYTKLLQYANGAVYDDDRNFHVVHDAKLDALEEALEELQGKPVLIFYQFQSDVARIQKRIPWITVLKNEKQIEAWNAKKIPALLAHAAGVGHGLNLQHGGNYIFWFGIPASMEYYWQAVKRIDRQGQKFPVFNVHFTIKGTPEAKVYGRLMDKTLTQDQLFSALKAD